MTNQQNSFLAHLPLRRNTSRPRAVMEAPPSPFPLNVWKTEFSLLRTSVLLPAAFTCSSEDYQHKAKAETSPPPGPLGSASYIPPNTERGNTCLYGLVPSVGAGDTLTHKQGHGTAERGRHQLRDFLHGQLLGRELDDVFRFLFLFTHICPGSETVSDLSGGAEASTQLQAACPGAFSYMRGVGRRI